MPIVFWGTPETSVPFLEFLCRHNNVVGTVTQPDKPSRRGQHPQKSPVKLFAEKKNVPILQPAVLKDAGFLSQLSNLKAELGIVVAYGRILPREVICLFPKGIFNIHFSFLPHLRGAAPIQWAILQGDPKTGVTSFKISETLDTGNVAVQKEIGISERDNASTLEEKLIPLGLLVLEETLKLIQDGTVVEKPQIGDVTFAPPIKKEAARIDWNKPAEELVRQVRALVRLGTFSRLPNGKILKILRAEARTPSQSSLSSPLFLETQPIGNLMEREGERLESYPPGAFCGIEKGRGFFVQCGIGNLLALKVQLEGKKEIDAWSFLQGSRLKIGDKFF